MTPAEISNYINSRRRTASELEMIARDAENARARAVSRELERNFSLAVRVRARNA